MTTTINFKKNIVHTTSALEGEELIIGKDNESVITIIPDDPPQSMTYKLPNAGGDTEFIMGMGDQNISGIKTFTNGIKSDTIFNDAGMVIKVEDIFKKLNANSKTPIAIDGPIVVNSESNIPIKNLMGVENRILRLYVECFEDSLLTFSDENNIVVNTTAIEIGNYPINIPLSDNELLQISAKGNLVIKGMCLKD